MFNVYLFLRQRDRAWMGAERETHTEFKAGSRLRAVSTEPDMGLKLTDCEIMTWGEVGRFINWTTQVPLKNIFLEFIYFWDKERGWKRETETDRYRVQQGRCREWGRHRLWNRLQAPSCQHRAWHGAWTHGPWDHDLSQSQTLDWLSHPGTPECWCYVDNVALNV